MNEIEELFGQLGEALISEIHAAMQAGEVSATGKTAESLRYDFTEDHFTLYGDKSFVWVEQGRGPGGQPPFDNILEWVEARHIQPEETGDKAQESMVWAIVKKIQQEGTGLFTSNKRRDVYSSVITSSRIDSFMSLVAAKYNNRIKTDLLFAIK